MPAFDSESFLKNLTGKPGVYRMLDAEGGILYVGKAKNLKKRVSSYFRKSGLPVKTQALMLQVCNVEITVTNTESEALLLESALIKEHKPRYNVLLRDDKSYPYIYISTDQDYPRISVHRGARKGKGRYFGPYPNAYAVRESLNLLQKVFKVRQCEDSFFRNRSRPCLQYQIKRCSAPCVNKITVEDYARDVNDTIAFLQGKNPELIDTLAERMEQASQALAFEQAAAFRDQIINLRRVQEKQYVSGEKGDLDILAAVIEGGIACVQVFFIRAGRNLGNKVFFPKMPDNADQNDILEAFISQYYSSHEIPGTILVNSAASFSELAELLSAHARHKVDITQPQRGERTRWLDLATRNAQHALNSRLASRAGMDERLEALRSALDLDELPDRIECFDISHTLGEATVASCVVFNAEGPLKSDYRRFNIEDITPGDDYAAMNQAISRRYTRIQKGEGKLPDLLLIDGGKGQVNAALQALEEVGVSDLTVVGVAKGPERRPGWEVLYRPGLPAVDLAPESRALHLIQQVRDEAHRFAITGHRARRARARTESPLEAIPGVGAKRRQELLKQFGGIREVARAGVEDLARVKGISPALAQQIYDAFHGGDTH